MSPQVFHILLALADGPAHGYAVMQAVERETRGAVRLGPGTLYGAIRRLRTEGLIAETMASEQGDAGRRSYRLTSSGRRALVGEAERLARLVEAARARAVLPADGV